MRQNLAKMFEHVFFHLAKFWSMGSTFWPDLIDVMSRVVNFPGIIMVSLFTIIIYCICYILFFYLGLWPGLCRSHKDFLKIHHHLFLLNGLLFRIYSLIHVTNVVLTLILGFELEIWYFVTWKTQKKLYIEIYCLYLGDFNQIKFKVSRLETKNYSQDKISRFVSESSWFTLVFSTFIRWKSQISD